MSMRSNVNIISRRIEDKVPGYIEKKMTGNRRTYTTTEKVSISLIFKCFVIKQHVASFMQQRNSALLGDSDIMDDTYDAYEKDIAVVSFYFEHPTVFEYARYGEVRRYLLAQLTKYH